MAHGNAEYISLRLIRRFLLRDSFLLRFGKFVPYYRPNRNQVDPGALVDDYERQLAAVGYDSRRARILEIGVGATNATGYEIAARLKPANLTLLEPFVPFAIAEDRALLETIARKYGMEPDALGSAARRVTTFAALPPHSIDLVLSSSVLEHVSDPPSLFSAARRALAPNGVMLHLVDYRDHFFKYPYHFLQFDRAYWRRWLNPGDLPVWRLYDHLEQLSAAGFRVRALETKTLPDEFALVRNRISKDFRRDDPHLAVTFAAIWAEAA
jgi:SAM-dependent methyltransferase